MRIAISGSASVGKSTLIKDFLQTWTNYKTTPESYRDVIASKNYPHSKKCNQEGQWAILNNMIDEMQKYSKDDNIIFDRCPLDNIVYSLWSFDKLASDIDENFIEKCIPLVRESLRLIDIIFFVPLTKVAPIIIQDDGMRETDPEYIAEIDNLFKSFKYQYDTTGDKSPFFPAGDMPAIIEIFGTREQRIALIQQYLNPNGTLLESTESIFNDESFKQIADLMNQQQTALNSERFEKDLRNGIKALKKKK